MSGWFVMSSRSSSLKLSQSAEWKEKVGVMGMRIGEEKMSFIIGRCSLEVRGPGETEWAKELEGLVRIISGEEGALGPK